MREAPLQFLFRKEVGDSTVAKGEASSRGRAVILVDDDEATAVMYRLGLEAAGFQVRVARDGDGLFSAFEVAIPEIVVLDWQLPGQNGDEVLHRIRLDDRTRSLPVLMLSNYPGIKNGAIDRVFAAGALAWLEKMNTPPAVLAERLIEALRRPG